MLIIPDEIRDAADKVDHWFRLKGIRNWKFAGIQSREEWLPVDEDTPRDRPILGWCDHRKSRYFSDDGKSLTTYGAHAESFGHCDDGPQILVWGGEYDHDDGRIPDWWFVHDSEFETVANPVLWKPIDTPDEYL